MKAELLTGEIVELPKDCGCVIHEGPHWLHMDDVRHDLNRRLLDTSPMGFAIEEQARLGDKLHEMTTRGIKRLIKE